MKANTKKDEEVLKLVRAGIYTVDSDGTVWSHKRTPSMTMKAATLPTGYRILNLRTGSGRGLMVYLHRMVALVHLPNPGGLPEVNHKDGDKSNCAVNNLEWVSSSDNTQHAIRQGLRPLGRCGRGFSRLIWAGTTD